MLRFRFPRRTPFRICFREPAPSELKHAFTDAGSAPGGQDSSRFRVFCLVCRYIHFLLTPSAPLKARNPRNVRVFSFSFRPALYTFLAAAGRTPCRNIVCHLEQPDQAPRKLEGAG